MKKLLILFALMLISITAYAGSGKGVILKTQDGQYLYYDTNNYLGVTVGAIVSSSSTMNATVYQGTDPWNISSSSSNALVTIYAGENIPVNVLSIISDSTTAKVEAYLNDNGTSITVDGTVTANIASIISDSTTAKVEAYIIDNGNVITVADERYENNTSTHTAGKLNASGNIPVTAFTVTQYSFYSDGADSSVAGIGGTIYCLDGIPASTTGVVEIGFTSPTFAVTLGAGATFYYEVWGTE